MCKWTQFFCFPFQTSCLLFSSLASLCVGRHPKDGITTMNRASSSSFLLCLYSRGTIRKGQQTSSVGRCGGVMLLRVCWWVAWATPLALSVHLGCSWGEMRYWPNCWPLSHEAVGVTVNWEAGTGCRHRLPFRPVQDWPLRLLSSRTHSSFDWLHLGLPPLSLLFHWWEVSPLPRASFWTAILFFFFF